MDLLTLLMLALAVVGAVGIGAYLSLGRTARDVAAQASGLRQAIGAALPSLNRIAGSLTPAAPATRYVYLRPGGQPGGPVELTTLRAMVVDGRLAADALAAAAGSDDWRPVAEVVDLDTPGGRDGLRPG